MMMKKSTRLALVILAGVLLSACLAPSTAPPDAQAPADSANADAPEMSTVSMRLQWIPQYQFAGYIVALVKGYYTEAGLDVTLNPGSPDFVPMPLVISGADTFGSTGADTIFLAREKGINVVALATMFQTSPVAFMVHSDSGIDDPSDFLNATVGVFYGDNVETEYRALLAAADVDRTQINEVPAQFNLEPFLSRRVDVWPVYATDQPDLAYQQGADVSLIVARDYGVTLMGDVLFATEEFVRDHPNTTQAFVSATLRGWNYALAHPDEAVEIIATYNSRLSADHLHFEATETQKLVQFGAGEQCPGWNDVQSWQAEQQVLVDLDIVSSVIPLEDAVQNEFVAAYYRAEGQECGE